MRKKHTSKYNSRYAAELVIIETKIIEIIEANKLQDSGKVKNVFVCESSKKPEGQVCILWGGANLAVGDEIQIQGRFKDNVFLAWSLNILKKQEANFFSDEREFRRKFPSRLYICPCCGNLTTTPYRCINCGNQNNNFLFADKTYTYKIQETGITETIFKPIELERSANAPVPQEKGKDNVK